MRRSERLGRALAAVMVEADVSMGRGPRGRVGVEAVLEAALAGCVGAVGVERRAHCGAGVRAPDLGDLLASPAHALVCWIHYLVFDLFVGAWIARDAARRDISRLLVAPCLVLTLLVGPVGLLLYLVVRLALRRVATLEETAAGG